MATRRSVLLFSRPAEAEVRAKGLPGAEDLFRAAGERLAGAVLSLGHVDLVRPLQRGATFAERLGNAIDDTRALGYSEIVVVPGDVPGLGEPQLRAAFRALEASDVVLGPCTDGGVYLIGCRGPVERLFRGVRWRTGHVLADLRARASGATMLAPLADLDRPGDLAALEDDPTLPPDLRALILTMTLGTPSVVPRADTTDRLPSFLSSAPDRPRGPPVSSPLS